MAQLEPIQEAETSQGPGRRRRLGYKALIAVVAILVPSMTLAVVSPFSDVDPSNPFFNNIIAVYNSGIAAGCGGGKFCPTTAVTREQMSAFLNRAAPRGSQSQFDYPLFGAVTDGATFGAVTVRSLKNEYLNISANFYGYIGPEAGTFPCERPFVISVDGVEDTGLFDMWLRTETQPPEYFLETLNATRMWSVGPGNHTVRLVYHDQLFGFPSEGSCNAQPARGTLTVQVVPFDGTMGSISAPSPLKPTSNTHKGGPTR